MYADVCDNWGLLLRVATVYSPISIFNGNDMSYELTGKIKLIQDEQTFNSGFRKREVVVSVEDGNYTQEINLEFVQDKAALLEQFSPGQEVTIAFNIRGREYNGRYFNNLVGWKIAAQNGDSPAKSEPDFAPSNAASSGNPFDDEVPF